MNKKMKKRIIRKIKNLMMLEDMNLNNFLLNKNKNNYIY